MAKQSAYLQRREAELDATFNAGAAMAMQFAMDTTAETRRRTSDRSTWIGCWRRLSTGRRS